MKFKLAKKINLSLALLMTMAIAGSCNAATNPTKVQTQYQSSSENFSNPERGFYEEWGPIGESTPVQLSEMQKIRTNNMSMIRLYYYISDFTNKPLSQSFLDRISNDFKTARQAGVKIIPRFIYNWGAGGGPDAPRDIILSQLDQLKPILQANYDVIAYMEAGFVGNWGEWHSSTNNLVNNNSLNGITEDSRKIFLKILSVLPTQRMVAIRLPRYKQQIFNNNNALTAAEAFNGSDRARTGHHNDAFRTNLNDSGTYGDWCVDCVEQGKAWTSLDTKYVVQGGEPFYSDPPEHSDCPAALTDLARMHWSAMTSNHSPGDVVYQKWRDKGCMEEIKRRLGYRFRLINSYIPDRVKPAGTFSMSFQVTNEGWASPYNPRNLEMVLRNKNTGQKYYLPVAEAVRMWMPGETKTVNITGGIPSNMPSGEYQVLLNLSDPTSTLGNRPEYSIRLANQNVWEASTGYNSLLRNVIVDQNAGGDTYSGSQFFKPSSGGNSQPSQTVTLYADANFTGKSQSFGIGTYRADQAQLAQVGSDNASSLRVPAGYKVRVCEHETGGICREYSPGDYSYVGDDLNDKISLVEVKAQ
jgi:hypothetical protein